MIAENQNVATAGSTDADTTARYLRALREGGSVEQVHQRLAALTRELINARVVRWVPSGPDAEAHSDGEINGAPTNAATSESPAANEDSPSARPVSPKNREEEELSQFVNRVATQAGPLIEASHGAGNATLIGIPVAAQGVLYCRLVAKQNALATFVALLRMAAGYFVIANERQGQSELQRVASEGQAALSLTAALLSETSREEALQAYCDQIRSGFRVPLVMLYVVSSHHRTPRLLVHSGADGETKQSEALGSEVKRLAATVAEEAVIAVGLDDATTSRPNHLRSGNVEALALQAGFRGVHAIPVLQSDGEPRCVLVVAGNDVSSTRFASLRRVVRGTSAALVDLTYRRRGANRRRQGLRRGARRLVITLLTLAAVAAAMAVPVPHRVRSPLKLVPTQRRHVAAPYDSILVSSLAKSGEVVKAGQVLGQLDDRPLKLEISRNRTELIRVRKQKEIHVARGEISEGQLASLRIEELSTAIDLLQQRIDQATIVAPIAGVVISQDLDDVQDAPVTQGQDLFEVAPLDSIRAEIEVPDYQAHLVALRQPVSVWIDDGSGRRLDGLVQRISPGTEVRRQRNVLLCELNLDNPDRSLRPGMDGQASIETGNARVGWILFHRLWDRLRVYLGV